MTALYPRSWLRDHDEYKKVKKQFDALFTGINIQGKENWLSVTGVWPTRYQIFKRNCGISMQKWEKAQKVSRILFQSAAMSYPDKQTESMNKMLAYMGLTESLGATMMNLALLFVIANGKEIHTKSLPPDHIETFEDLEKLWDVDYKLSFLDSAGISIFRDMIINKHVRNEIAHLKFNIDANGEIRDSGDNPIDVDHIITRFYEGIGIFELVLEDVGFIAWAKKMITEKEGAP